MPAYSPPILQTSFHSSAVTGCTDRREYFTSAMAASFFSALMAAIVTGFGRGVVEGLTKVFFPEASNTVIFVIMAIVLLIRPAGLFGRRA